MVILAVTPLSNITRNSTESTHHQQQTILQTSSPWQAVCPSSRVDSMDPPNSMQITSLEGVAEGVITGFIQINKLSMQLI
jgi:hypothetical protein